LAVQAPSASSWHCPTAREKILVNQGPKDENQVLRYNHGYLPDCARVREIS